MKNLAYTLLCSLLLIIACKSEAEIDLPSTPTTPEMEEEMEMESMPPTNIEDWQPAMQNAVVSVIGQVVDRDNEPIVDALITLDNQTYTTDIYGHFFITNKNLNRAGSFLVVEKEGYFKGSRRFFPKEEVKNRVKIQLIEKVFNQSFAANDGGTIQGGDGALVEFAPSSFSTESGAIYTGMVQVAAKWLNPSLVESFDQMPGNLQGINTQITEVALATYGMIVVELEDESGNPLQLTTGKTATLTMPVPNNLLAGAPRDIPLWYFNENLGMWVEEGAASLVDGNYVGAVSHFSFWNCDDPFLLINLDFQVETSDGIVLDNYLVEIQISGSSTLGSTGYGYTDSDGTIDALVPKEEVLIIKIHSECGDIILEEMVGPFGMDTSLGTLVVPASSSFNTTFSGTLLDCNNDPLINGVVVLEEGDNRYYHYTDAADFTFSRVTCGVSDLTIKGINTTEVIQSNASPAMHDTNNDLGDIIVCDNLLENFISITVDGTTAIFLNAAYESNGADTNIFSRDNTSNDHIAFLGFDGITVGDYKDNHFMEVIRSDIYDWDLFPDSATGQFENFEVTQYGPKIIGTFSGKVTGKGAGENSVLVGEFSINL